MNLPHCAGDVENKFQLRFDRHKIRSPSDLLYIK
jgi:hypothetical protein